MSIAFTALLATLGPFALALLVSVVFAETGLLLGFFLPGDSILFAAGVYVAAGVIPVPLWLVIAATWAAAVAGDQVAFGIGRWLGPRLLERPEGRILNARHLGATSVFFERHGHKAVVLARFIPLVRTFTPAVAGAVGMPRGRFTAYNVMGGFAWTVSMLTAGYLLGGVDLVASHVELITLGLVTCSVLPAVVAVVRRRRHGSQPPAPEPVLLDAASTR